MSLQALLHILLRRFTALTKALRHWDVRACLRLLLSKLSKRAVGQGDSDLREAVSIETAPAEHAEVCCSVVPATSQTYLHVANSARPERATPIAARPSSSSGSPYLSLSPLWRDTSRTSDVFPYIPQPRAGRWLRGITPEDLPRYQRRAPMYVNQGLFGRLRTLRSLDASLVPNGT